MKSKNNEVKSVIKVVLTPSSADYKKAMDKFHEIYGKNANQFDLKPEFDALTKPFYTNHTLKNVSINQASSFAEVIRIQHPERHVNIYYDLNPVTGKDAKSFIGNTTWKDQMEQFPEYPVYTRTGFDQRVEALKTQHATMQNRGKWLNCPLQVHLDDMLENQKSITLK